MRSPSQRGISCVSLARRMPRKAYDTVATPDPKERPDAPVVPRWSRARRVARRAARRLTRARRARQRAATRQRLQCLPRPTGQRSAVCEEISEGIPSLEPRHACVGIRDVGTSSCPTCSMCQPRAATDIVRALPAWGVERLVRMMR